jgi:sulfur carrier protein ThiS
VPRSTAEKLVQELSQIMPPLSDADTVSLYVLLPLLSASLHGDLVESKMNEDAMETNEKKMEDLLAELSLPLAEFALGNEYEAKARAAAASCLHAAISLFSNTTADCPIQKIQVDVVNRVIRSSLAQKVSDYSSLVDALKLSALLVSIVSSLRAYE